LPPAPYFRRIGCCGGFRAKEARVALLELELYTTYLTNFLTGWW
jgi:hypothetical protein